MNIKCLFRHKWEYGTEEVTYTAILAVKKEMTMIHRSRCCERCSLKQIQMIGGDWIKWGMSTEEKRDKKLKDLGI